MGKPRKQSILLKKYFNLDAFPTSWCAGCGIGTIIGAIIRGIENSGIPKHKFVFITGIGCYGGSGTYLQFSDIHALHGRCPSYATGLKLARPDVYPILLMGDGDASAIGGNHLIHAARRNIDLTAVVINNHTYGMTGGQYSPTTPLGTTASTAPFGQIENSFDLCKLLLGAGATFVARSTTYAVKQLVEYLSLAILHRGFSFVEVESICPTYFSGWGKKGKPVDMLKWQKKKSISLQKAKALDKKDLEGRIVTGIFINETRDEYVTAYDTVKKSTRNNRSGKEAAVHSVPIPSRAKNPIPKREIRFAGAGGQGIVLAAIILSEAAGIVEGREVVQTQSYGVEARGGASRAEVIISDQEIVFPEIINADILIAMNTQSLEKFSGSLHDNGMLIYNSSSIEKPAPMGSVRVYGIPLSDLARKAGGEIAGNMAALGALVGLAKVVSEASIEKAMAKRIPPGTEALNLNAFKLGLAAAQTMSGE